MEKYNPNKIEKKWQIIWEKEGLYKTDLKKGPKFYCLVMFPYPSADKLHIGHWYNFGPTDTYARFKKMRGFNVFEPMGFDAFGLPAENYAIQTGVHPKKSTQENIQYIRKQLKQIGAMYDWSSEIVTSDPSYYKWTQWLFLKLYENGLAYKKKAPANFCPSCKTVLANEQVLDGRCERCDSQVIQKDMEQWFFKITNYAERLLSDLKKLDWPEKTKVMQENWIGRSEGAIIKFQIPNSKFQIDVFTTRPDTLFGATYLVLAPEHPMVLKLTTRNRFQQVKRYIEKTKKKREIERISLKKEKTGLFLGSYAINPLNNKKIPIWISDYVLVHYGTGAIMCVPAHDQRDFEFAKKFKLPIRQVIKPCSFGMSKNELEKAYEGRGKMINSGKWNGMESEKFKEEIVRWLSKKGLAEKSVCYKLRDWLISRQRYWGAPIPIIYCQKCGQVPVPEKDLPVLLPEKVDFKPTGQSPLARSPKFYQTKCPKCHQPAKRETDTLDTFVCSSWYFLRYLSPALEEKPWDEELVKKWLPVDLYVGGTEHATMHLIYARFLTKALYDLGYLPFNEPFKKLRHQGTITYRGAKMSKSRRNVVEPDPFIKKYGSDTFRIYLEFMGPYDEGGDWSDKGIVGIWRFLNRVYNLIENLKLKIEKRDNKEIQKRLHQTIKKVTEDLENLRFNTAIASLMEWLNLASNNKKIVTQEMLDIYLKLLAPFAPHLSEELWSKFGHKRSIFQEKWPEYDEKIIKEEKIIIVIQVNGKVRDKIEVEAATSEGEIKKLAQDTPKIKKWIGKKKIKKVIYVPGRLVNLVI